MDLHFIFEHATFLSLYTYNRNSERKQPELKNIQQELLRKVTKAMEETQKQIRQFIIDNFLFGDGENLENDTSFMENGIIDSTGILELVAFLEQNFNITIEDDELVAENLDSLNNVTNYLSRKLTCVE